MDIQDLQMRIDVDDTQLVNAKEAIERLQTNTQNWLFVVVILLGLVLGVQIVNNMKK